MPPKEVFAEAKALWLSRAWPKAYEAGYDPVAEEVMFTLVGARDLGLTEDDIPAMLDYLRAPPAQVDKGRERFYGHMETLIDRAPGDPAASDEYYGSESPDAEDEWNELTIPDPDERRLHRALRLDPMSAWDELRARLCEPPPRNEMFLSDAIEHLMYAQPAAFIDRLERVADQCPASHSALVMAHIGGVAASPAMERFWRLQERSADSLIAKGELYGARRYPPFRD